MANPKGRGASLTGLGNTPALIRLTALIRMTALIRLTGLTSPPAQTRPAQTRPGRLARHNPVCPTGKQGQPREQGQSARTGGTRYALRVMPHGSAGRKYAIPTAILQACVHGTMWQCIHDPA